MRILLDECVPRRLRRSMTVDQSIRHQQNLQAAGVAVVVLVAPSNRLADLVPLMPSALASLGSVKPGDVVEITA
jgi:hypothetical protein